MGPTYLVLLRGEKAVARARSEQDWYLRPGYIQAQPKELPCFACAGVATEQHTCVGFIP